MNYRFYGWERADMSPVSSKYGKIKDPKALYDLLSDVWSEETCAPRLRPQWSAQNKTLGQCSITSFLVQDIFGGEVYGVPLAGGGFHCFNVVDGKAFDLTSEQFGEEKLTFDLNYPQIREEHFSSEEKYNRYSLLKKELQKRIE